MTQGWNGGTQDPKIGHTDAASPTMGGEGPQRGYPHMGVPAGNSPHGGHSPTGYPQQVSAQPGTEQHPYAQPGYAQPGYAQPGYAQPGYAQPGYAPGYQQAGYLHAAYGQQYSPLPPEARKPGVVNGAAVLAFVQAGIIIVAGIVAVSGGSALSNLDYRTRNWQDTQLLIMGVLTLVAGGLLIAGGVAAYNKKFALLLGGAGLSLALSVWWAILVSKMPFASTWLVWVLLLAVMPIISTALVLGTTAQRWSKTPTA
ncbi:hypothetical protein EH165_02980 [Nakamurella antarctica]|uniref:Uncharacterized protein n=1 Tax=Nakamurella antarctica TaxID=1902245 RepID=A0A3G8ZKG7_9ACTN|nr:hypothetical protein [Nakamurella antarctica]AZI57277.1 hypothetical protein EH165_02980 [Nakamurella antarctica]